MPINIIAGIRFVQNMARNLISQEARPHADERQSKRPGHHGSVVIPLSSFRIFLCRGTGVIGIPKKVVFWGDGSQVVGGRHR
jgi:hypothetical protein